jgi:hypothetical protein
MKMRHFLCYFLLWTALVSPALAHHIMGIPHYAYDKNYPQLPFVETTAQSGDWDLRLTYLPGVVEPGQRIRFKLYGKNRVSGDPLRVPLVGQARKVAFGSKPKPLGEAFPVRVGKGPEGNDYKFFLTFPDYDSYEILIRFEFPGGSVEEIPFPVAVGVTDDTNLLIGAVGLLCFAVICVRVVKTREAAARQEVRAGKVKA